MARKSIVNKPEIREACKGDNFLAIALDCGVEVAHRGFGNRVPCICPNPSHGDRHYGNAYVNVAGQWNGTIHCHACGKTYNAFELVQELKGISDVVEIYSYLSSMTGVPVRYEEGDVKYTPRKKKTRKEVLMDAYSRPSINEGRQFQSYMDWYRECQKNLQASAEAQEYLSKRGISKETAERFGIGFSWCYKAPRIIIPITRHYWLARDIRKNPKGSEASRFEKFKTPGGPSGVLYNQGALDGQSPVFIVEGEFDALSIMELGYEALAIGGCGNVPSLIKALLKRHKEGKILPPILICMDNDEAGEKAMRRILEEVKILEIPVKIAFSESNSERSLYGKYKDANEFLVQERDVCKKRLESVIKGVTSKA